MDSNIEKSADLAKETLAKLTKTETTDSKEETKGASTEEGKEKTEGKEPVQTAEQVEAQAKEDERILSADESELSDDDKKRKTVLDEAKKKKAESPEEKIKRIQEQTQRRIDEISSELKEKDAKSAEKIKQLEAELAELKKPKQIEDAKSQQKRLLDERLAKYVEEDKSKPRVERREMSKDELDEWFLEDPISATEWMNERTLRRVDDRKSIQKELEKPRDEERLAQDFIEKQNQSLAKLGAKYPSVVRLGVEFNAVFGKSDAEVDRLMANESDEARMAIKLVNSNPRKYLEQVDGPEQVMAELDKHFQKKAKTITLTEEELQARLDARAAQEAERLANLDEGLSSRGGRKMDKEEKKSDNRLRQEAIAKKAKIPMADLDKTIERRRNMGVVTYED